MRHLLYFERQVIEICLASHKSHRQIAHTLSRDRRVIDREIERNKPQGRPYRAKLAQELTDQRESKRCRGKMDKNKLLQTFIVQQIQEDLSPEQIAGILYDEGQNPLQDKAKVCPETIYQYIYNRSACYLHLYKHLRKHHKRRIKRGSRKQRKERILERISIHHRPLVIDQKKRLGDFECDLIEGSRKGKHALSVHYERKSQYVKIHRVYNKTAEETNRAISYTKETLPESFMKSITFDNGMETTKHHVIRYEHNIDTFHCDPYCSWQKGGVENMNGLIRQYIHKGTNIEQYTDAYLKEIETKLNNRPRKSLQYKSPNQILVQAGWGIRS